jgi:hypothetical protein
MVVGTMTVPISQMRKRRLREKREFFLSLTDTQQEGRIPLTSSTPLLAAWLTCGQEHLTLDSEDNHVNSLCWSLSGFLVPSFPRAFIIFFWD